MDCAPVKLSGRMAADRSGGIEVMLVSIIERRTIQLSMKAEDVDNQGTDKWKTFKMGKISGTTARNIRAAGTIDGKTNLKVLKKYSN